MNLLHLVESEVKMKRVSVDKTVDGAKQPETFQLFLQIRKARVVLIPSHLLILPQLCVNIALWSMEATAGRELCLSASFYTGFKIVEPL